METSVIEDRTNCLLDIADIYVGYGSQKVLNGLNLQLKQQELLCILGASGCGKSTLLRAIAGFEQLHKGHIYAAETLIADTQFMLPPEQRQIGMVFQDVALFPHLTVEENIAFGLQRLGKEQKRKRINQLLHLMNLQGFNQRYPSALSGGQQRRIALARAIAPKPKLLLMDEPFNGLDASLREALAPEVANILRQERIGAILVTHDQKEAFSFADQIAVMHQGSLEQKSSVYDIYHKPKTRFVADFICEGDFVPGKLEANHLTSCLGKLEVSNKQLAQLADYAQDEITDIDIFIRPDDVLHDDLSPIKGRIVSRRFRGTHFLYRIQLPTGEEIACFADSHHDHPIGHNLGISFNLQHVILFPT